MRIWFDMTAPAHPVVFRPVIERLIAAGHDVEVTGRAYAETQQLLDRMGTPYHAIGRHGGASRAGKFASLASRAVEMFGFARRRRFDLAVGHGSNELAVAARWLKIPAVNAFDYEFALQQHNVGCRPARRVLTPEAIPLARLRRFGVDENKHFPYPGLKEEYYLADFEPDASVLDEIGADPARVIVVLRPPPEASLYHRKSNRLFPAVLDELGRREDVHAVVLPRSDEQRVFVRAFGLPSLIVPEKAIDAQSLIAFSDLVISAGGTMNREAAALGVPVYTTYGGRLGGVDEQLIRERRLRPLTDRRAIDIVKRDHSGVADRVRRDPAVLVDLVTGAAR